MQQSTKLVLPSKRRHAVLNNKAEDMPFGWWDSSLPTSDLPSALMAALGAIMIMMEISQAITGRQCRAHCRHTNGLICNWKRGKWLCELAVALFDWVSGSLCWVWQMKWVSWLWELNFCASLIPACMQKLTLPLWSAGSQPPWDCTCRWNYIS